MFYGQHYQRVREDADDYGGDAVEQVSGVAHDKGKSFATEFGEIDASEKTYGKAHYCGEEQEFQATDDGVGHAAAGFADGFGELREEIQVEGCAAVPN